MKTLILSIFVFFQQFNGYSQKTGDIFTLKGYFILSCFDSTNKNKCDLNIKTIKSITGENITCSDGNFYKNISIIMYIKSKDLDLKQIDDFNYQVELQKNEHYVFLSTNPLILLDAYKNDSNILKNTKLVKSIIQNQITADSIQKQIDKLNINFTKKRHYYVLMEVSLKVIVLPKRIRPKTYTDVFGLDQYLIIQDKTNTIKVVKLIKDPF